MVLKAARLQLQTAEVPVKFYKDRDGRLSHHRRAGWMSPWIAGWVTLKVMLVYSPDSFLVRPGFLLLGVGILLSVPLSFGAITIGPLVFNLYWMLVGLTATTLGYSFIQVGVLARIMHGLRSGVAGVVQRQLTYNRGMAISAACCGVGFLLGAAFAAQWIAHGLKIFAVSNSAILGLMLIIIGFQTFGFTLLLEMAQRVISRPPRE
jgi:hypothetical protein